MRWKDENKIGISEKIQENDNRLSFLIILEISVAIAHKVQSFIFFVDAFIKIKLYY